MNTYWQSLSKEEQKYQIRATTRLQKMRDQREKQDKEKNNLSYSQMYNLNRESDLAYSDMSLMIQNRENEDSITQKYEMTSGATRTKDTSLVSHLNSFKFEPDIVAFNKDNKIEYDLGENVEDLILKSLEIETWKNRQIDAQREFIAQGNVFIREVLVQKPIRIHDNGKWVAWMPINKFEVDKNSITKFETRFERQLILGKNVFLSSIRERDIQRQTEVAVWEEMSFVKAESIYWEWDRFEYVEETRGKKCASQIETIIATDKDTSNWATEDYWNLMSPDDEVGILHVYNSINKTYQIFINGIMMLPIGYSIYEVSPSGLIPIAKGDAEIIPWYAYAKGIPANTLVDTKMYDMVWNGVTQKMLQGVKPTMANNTGHTIASNMLYSGRLINGLRANGLTPVLPEESRNITSSDTAYMDIVRGIISDKSIDDAFSGQPVGVNTATEFLERKKNTTLKLFSLIEGWKDVERQLARLRIASIFSKWTTPEEQYYFKDIVELRDGIETITGKEKTPSKKRVHRTELVKTKMRQTGQEWYKDIRFSSSDEMPDEEDIDEIAKEEDRLTKEYKKPTRITYLNTESLSRLFEWNWFIDVRSAREDESHLDLMVYIDAKTRISQLFPDSLNRDYTLQKIANIQNEDFEKAFNSQKPQAQQAVDSMSAMKGWQAVKNPLENVKADQLSIAPPM